MGFLDKLKGNRRGGDGGGGTAPADFDELQAAMDAGQVPAARAVEPGDSVLEAPAVASTLVPPEHDSAIISELPPSSQRGEFSDSRQGLAAAGVGAAAAAGLPVIGHRPVPEQQRILAIVLGLGLLLLVASTILALTSASRNATQVAATGHALMQSQRLAKAVSQAVVGNATAFGEVKESVAVLASNVRGLKDGAAGIAAAPGAVQEELQPLMPLVDRAEKSATVVLGQQKTLTQVGEALRAINRQSVDLLETAETVSSLKLQQGASAAELSAVGQVVMLTQRIGKSANEFLTFEGVSPEAVFLLGKDLNSFREIVDGLIEGNAELRLPGTKDGAAREQLAKLKTQFAQTQTQANAILGILQGLVSARDAQNVVIKDSEPLRKGQESVQNALGSAGGFRAVHLVALLLGVAMVAVAAYGFLRLFVTDQAQRAGVAEAQALEAERQEQEAKRVNDANQAAILRLMNELQSVAEGDLTQQATVTEDITGAIADSVNYTVEELRNLVAQVQGTAARVAETTQRVDDNSTELLAASDEQLREIRETGESVLQMAQRINEVSAQAQQLAHVARQSLRAAESGLSAVQNSIGGMNAIRDQIQDRKSTRLNSSHRLTSRMPSSA
jgi:twitching motility protein PilJ